MADVILDRIRLNSHELKKSRHLKSKPIGHYRTIGFFVAYRRGEGLLNCVPDTVLGAPDSILNFAAQLFALAFGFKFLVAAHFTGGFLHRTFNLVADTGSTILVHKASPFLINCCRALDCASPRLKVGSGLAWVSGARGPWLHVRVCNGL
jgi:hypothetical protein